MNTQQILPVSFLLLFAATAGRAEFQVNTWTTRSQEKARVAMDANGDFVVVWRSHSGDGRGGGVFGQRFDALGNRAGGEFQISAGNNPSVAMDPAGNFVVAWDGSGIRAQRYDSNGVAVGDEIQVNTDGPTPTLPEYLPRYPDVAMNDAGAFVVVWATWRGTDAHTGEHQIDGHAFDSGGSPRGPEFRVSQVAHGHSAKVAIDNRGDFVVSWRREGDSNHPPPGRCIKTRRFNADGTPKGPAVEVNDVPFSVASLFSLAMDGSGRFVVAWTQSDDLYARRFDADGNRIGPEFILGPGAGSRASAPSIAMHVDGQFLATWHRGELGNKDVFGRWFSRHGSPGSREFRINTHTTSDQSFPCAAMNDTGEHVVVVWQSDGQDGSDYGVFGEIGLALPASAPRWDTYR